MQGIEQKLDECGGISKLVADSEHLVIVLLSLADHGFHGQVGKKWIPATENECLPQATHAAVAVSEGMDEFQLIVEYAACDERMGIGAFQPVEQFLHQRGNAGSGWSEVGDVFPLDDADGGGAEVSGVRGEALHQKVMRGSALAARL